MSVTRSIYPSLSNSVSPDVSTNRLRASFYTSLKTNKGSWDYLVHSEDFKDRHMFLYTFHRDVRRFGPWLHWTSLWEVCTLRLGGLTQKPHGPGSKHRDTDMQHHGQGWKTPQRKSSFKHDTESRSWRCRPGILGRSLRWEDCKVKASLGK